MRSLANLNASHNRLTSFPDVLPAMKKLTGLTLDHTLLESLPAGIGEKDTLRSLFVSHNRLSTLPPSILDLPVEYLNVRNNRLCFPPPAQADSLTQRMRAWIEKSQIAYGDPWESTQDCR